MEVVAAGETVLRLDAADASQVGVARRFASALAARLGFSEEDRSNVAIVATELAGNLVKHARGGELIVGRAAGEPAVEMLALDRGPGMEDVSRCMRDGYSTAGSPGTGLGAVSRLASAFGIHSEPGAGTAVLARVRARENGRPGAAPRDGALEAGAVCLPVATEDVSGDGWAAARFGAREVLTVVDGIGHGALAADAAREAIAAFRAAAAGEPGDVLEAMHAALRGTRGAAAAVAAVDREARRVTYAGVGNIAGAVISGERVRQMVSHNGIVGHEARKIQEFVYPWPEGALLVMHSDGLSSQWRLDRYRGLSAAHPALVAGVLYRDFSRGRDDVTVVAARDGGWGGPR